MLVCGDQFLQFAQIVLRSKDRNDYYEVVNWNKKTLFYFEDIPYNWNNPSLIFCNTEDCQLLKNKLQYFNNKFVLLSHNSDTNVTEEFSFIYENPIVHHWFTQNAIVTHPKVTFLPIGKANPVWHHGNVEFFHKIDEIQPQKVNYFYANFLVQTNYAKRELCQTILKQLNIYNHPKTHPLQFFLDLASSYYSICPEGNGIDTHRFWESIYFKTIPIVIRSPFTEKIAKEYPCCLIDSWDKLHEQLIPYDIHLFNNTLEKTDFEYFKTQIFTSLNSI